MLSALESDALIMLLQRHSLWQHPDERLAMDDEIAEQDNFQLSEKVYHMPFSKVYPLLVNKAVRKGRTAEEVDRVIQWLTGYDADGLKAVLDSEASYEKFFDEAP